MNHAAVLDEYLDGLLESAPAADAAPVAEPARALMPAQAPTPDHAPAPEPVPERVAAPIASAPAARPALALPDLTPRQPRAVSALAAATDPVAPPHRRAAERASRWLRLRCASQAYGLELLKVQEVVLPTPLLPLRGTPAAMLGVMNLRGQVVPVMDLGVYLGQAPQPASTATRIVVLEEKGETLGLRVSAVEDVVNLTDAQIEAPDNSRVGRIHSDLFRGIARQAAEPVILLDASRLLAPAGPAAH